VAEPEPAPRPAWPGARSNVAEVRAGFALVVLAIVLELLAFLEGPRNRALTAASWVVDRCGDWRWFVWLVPLAVGATGLGLVLHGARNETEEGPSFRAALLASIGAVLAIGAVLFFSFRPGCTPVRAPGA